MRINELVTEFTIQTSNEEKEVLGKLKSAKNLDTFMERDQEVINQLVRKSLVRKIEQDNNVMVVANAGQETR
jgi:DNA-binding MltR family transcriptional regulator|tara:strand:- start:41 stop:256 length:216 start_codon:yes stop_codon:yes gene_type:complete